MRLLFELLLIMAPSFAAGYFARDVWPRPEPEPEDEPVPVVTTVRKKSAAYRRRTGDVG